MCGRQRHGCGGVGVARERTGRFGAESCTSTTQHEATPTEANGSGRRGPKAPLAFSPEIRSQKRAVPDT